jgi:signal transduction histidine kinase/CheY-like chemotaxis protein
MIELGKLTINTPIALKETGHMVHELSHRLGFGSIQASRLATIFTELSRPALLEDLCTHVDIRLDQTPKGTGLLFSVRCDAPVSWAPSAAGFFTSVDTCVTDDAGHDFSGFILLPDPDETPSEDCISSIKQLLSQPSREQLLSDLLKKNEDLERSAQELRLAKERTEEATRKLKIRVEELAKAKRTMRNIMVDLDEAKKEAELASRAKSDFLANMSHEIRTPMNAIIGMNYLMSQTELTHKQKDYVQKIQSSSQSLLGVINDILDFSKIEAGKLDMEAVEFNLDDVLNNTANLVQAKASEMEMVEVNFVTAPDVPRFLVGDPLRLGQILINLTNNALKFTEEGEIVISTDVREKQGDRLVLSFSVRDTGIGLTAKQIKNLFQPFTQADTSTTRQYGGTGLGLTICHNLVSMMEGRIEVESEPGKGSVFSFTARFGYGTRKDAKTFDPTPDLKGMRVLVVDDNATARNLLHSMLTAFTFDVTLAKSGAQGLAELENAEEDRPYELVIMDWQMPGMNGIETSVRIKNHTGLIKSPTIIMATSYSSGDIMNKAEEAGINGFLAKPFSPSDLFNCIMQVMGKENKSLSVNHGFRHTNLDEFRPVMGALILLVEDNEMNQQVACEILEQVGFIVHIANNGAEALTMVRQNTYDAVLMDIQMPVMDGCQASLEIRKDEQFKNLPIIAMTAHAMAGDKEKSLGAGMNDHINKPIEPNELFSSLLKWIKPGNRNIPRELLVKMEQTSSAPSPAHLPDKPGVAAGIGLSRLGNNQTLYLKLLAKFVREYTDATDQLRQCFAREDYDTARRIAHSIKGVSGNIGALEVQKAAADLEIAYRDRAIDGLEELLAEFDGHLTTALVSMKEYQPAEADTQKSVAQGPVKTPAELLVKVVKLAAFVKDREAKPAKKCVREIAGASWPGEYVADIADLNTLISKYKFKEAQKIVNQLVEQLQG